MTLYKYTHNDGRTGQSNSGWQAMLAALGNEAHDLDLNKTEWHPNRRYSQVGDYADIYASGQVIGKLENIG